MFNKEGESAEGTAAPAPSDQAPAGEVDVVALAADRDRLAAENADLKDRLLRRVAEFDNFRKRAEREKAELGDFSTMETLRRLLPFLDDFERAVKSETSDGEYAKGMELILQRLETELQRMGLERIPSVGQAFDPHVHHALEMYPTTEAEENIVLAEHQRGYRFRGKLLRPALVRVAVAPPVRELTEP